MYPEFESALLVSNCDHTDTHMPQCRYKNRYTGICYSYTKNFKSTENNKLSAFLTYLMTFRSKLVCCLSMSACSSATFHKHTN